MRRAHVPSQITWGARGEIKRGRLLSGDRHRLAASPHIDYHTATVITTSGFITCATCLDIASALVESPLRAQIGNYR